ncbi:MAG TPA: beta-N-acetylhexosaminidase, partial [Ruminococcaceae bacterium]|nr:beta-N-acetylhexosaminidase [Oscillospiraceae bacterium]
MGVSDMNNISFNKLGVMIDCSRNAVMSVPTLKRWIDITASLGYNMLMLYTEDTYEVDNQPYFGYLRGRYSQKELREIDDYAFEHGMELIPAIQTLAHLKSIFRWPAYIGINDCEDILLAGDENTYKLIDDIFASLEKTLRTRIVN